MHDFLEAQTPTRVTDGELLSLYESKEREYLRAANRVRGILRSATAMGDTDGVEDFSLAVRTLEKRANDLRKFIDIIKEVDHRDKQPI